MRRIRFTPAALMLALLICIASPDAQTAPRTARVSGVLVDDAGTPVDRALLAITSADLPGARTAISDDDGHFAFTELPAGRFRLFASKNLHVDAEYGQRASGDLATTIRLSAGQSLDGLRFQLSRTAVVSGLCVDETGQTTPTCSLLGRPARPGFDDIRFIRMSYDGQGGYRIEGFAPGHYELKTTLTAEPVVITLHAGETLTGVTLTTPSPRARPAAPLAVTVMWPDGGIARDAQFRLESLDGGVDIGSSPSRPDADGVYTFPAVPAGRYRLFAHAAVFERTPGDSTFLSYWASVDTITDGRVPESLRLTLVPGITLSGRIRFDGQTLTAPVNLSRVGVQLVPKDGRQRTSYGAGGNVADHTNADGTFTIRGVPPGRYGLRVQSFERMKDLLEGWTAESAMLDEVDVLDVPIDVGAKDIGGIEIRVTDSTGELSGTLTTPTGEPTSDGVVIAFSPDSRTWTAGARKVRAARPDTSGEFLIAGLPAGTYLVAAVADVAPNGWFDPALLTKLRDAATPVTIASTPVRVSIGIR